MKKFNFLVASFLLALATSASAEGMYAKVSGGFSMNPETTVKYKGKEDNDSGDVKYKTKGGMSGSIALGMDASDFIAPGVAIEIEGTYFSNKMKDYLKKNTFSGVTLAVEDGVARTPADANRLGMVSDNTTRYTFDEDKAKQEAMSLMLNVVYNIDSLDGPVVPFVSFGVGMVKMELKGLTEEEHKYFMNAVDNADLPATNVTNTVKVAKLPLLKTSGFGINGKFGIKYAVNESVSLTASYSLTHRFESKENYDWVSATPKIDAGQPVTVPVAPSTDGTVAPKTNDFKWSNTFHSFGLGLLVKF